MINYRKILELYFDGISQRTIRSSTGRSRNKISEVIQRAKKYKLTMPIRRKPGFGLALALIP